MNIKRLFGAPHFRVLSLVFICLVVLLQNANAANPLIPAAPQIAASSYLLMDANSGSVLIEQNSSQPLPPASLTKMMTAYIAAHELDQGNIKHDDLVQISVKAWQAEGSRMFVQEGTQVSLENLLRGIIIQSGNDASIAVAEHVAGGEDAFADLMNQHAQLLGMQSTQFKNSTGLPAEDHYTTAADLGLLAQAIIIRHPEHYSMYAEQYFTYNDIKQPNRNRLLWRDKSVDGLKTGHTEEAGYCLVASAQRDEMRLISVVLGASSEESRATESQKLLTYGFRFFETHSLYQANQQIEEARVWGGEGDLATFGVLNNIIVTIPKGQRNSLEATLSLDEYLEAPISAGAEYGRLTITLDGKTLVDEPIVALKEIKEGGFFKGIMDSANLFFIRLIE